MQAHRTAQLTAPLRRFQGALAEMTNDTKEVKRGATTSTTLTDNTAFSEYSRVTDSLGETTPRERRAL